MISEPEIEGIGPTETGNSLLYFGNIYEQELGPTGTSSFLQNIFLGRGEEKKY